LTVGCTGAAWLTGVAEAAGECWAGEHGAGDKGCAGAEVDSACLGEVAEADTAGERRVKDTERPGTAELAAFLMGHLGFGLSFAITGTAGLS
jgi:hypothetical protein